MGSKISPDFRSLLEIVSSESSWGEFYGNITSQSTTSIKPLADVVTEWISYQVQQIVELVSSKKVLCQVTTVDINISSIHRMSDLYCYFVFHQVSNNMDSFIANITKLLKLTNTNSNDSNAQFIPISSSCLLVSYALIIEFMKSIFETIRSILPHFGLPFAKLLAEHAAFSNWKHIDELKLYLDFQIPSTMQVSDSAILRSIRNHQVKQFRTREEMQTDFGEKNDHALLKEQEKFYEELYSNFEKFSIYYKNNFVQIATDAAKLKHYREIYLSYIKDFIAITINRISMRNISFASDMIVQMYLHYVIHSYQISFNSATKSSEKMSKLEDIIGGDRGNKKPTSTTSNTVTPTLSPSPLVSSAVSGGNPGTRNNRTNNTVSGDTFSQAKYPFVPQVPCKGEDILFPSLTLYFGELLKYTHVSSSKLNTYIEQSILHSIQHQTLLCSTSRNNASNVNNVAHTKNTTFSVLMNNHLLTHDEMNANLASALYEDYDILVLNLKKLQALGKLLGYLQCLPFGLTIVSRSVSSTNEATLPSDCPFLQNEERKIWGMKLPLLNLLEESTGTDTLLPTIAWILEYLLILSFIQNEYQQRYHYTLYQDVFHWLFEFTHSFNPKSTLVNTAIPLPDLKMFMQSDERMFLLISLQSFWRSFPQIYQYFEKNSTTLSSHISSITSPAQNAKTISSKNNNWRHATSSNPRFYLTEFCLFYLLPSYYISHTTPMDVLPPVSAAIVHRSHVSVPSSTSNSSVVAVNELKAVSAVHTSSESQKLTEVHKQAVSATSNKKRIILTTTPKPSNTATFTATSTTSTNINSPNSVDIFQSIDTTNTVTSATVNQIFAPPIVNPSSFPLFAPPLSTPPSTKARKVMDDKASISSSKNPSVTTTPRRSTATKKITPTSSNTLNANTLPRNSPIKSISHSSLNLLNKFNASSPSPATLLNLSHANSLDHHDVSLMGYEPKKQFFPEQIDTPIAPEFSMVDHPAQSIPIPTSLTQEYLKEIEESFWTQHQELYAVCLFIYRNCDQSFRAQCKQYVQQGILSFKDRMEERYVNYATTLSLESLSLIDKQGGKLQKEIAIELMQIDYEAIHQQMITQCRHCLHTMLRKHFFPTTSSSEEYHAAAADKQGNSLYEVYYGVLYQEDVTILQLANEYTYGYLYALGGEIYEESIKYTKKKLDEMLHKFIMKTDIIHLHKITSLATKVSILHRSTEETAMVNADKMMMNNNQVKRQSSYYQEYFPHFQEFVLPLIDLFVDQTAATATATSTESMFLYHKLLSYSVESLFQQATASTAVANIFHRILQAFRTCLEHIHYRYLHYPIHYEDDKLGIKETQQLFQSYPWQITLSTMQSVLFQDFVHAPMKMFYQLLQVFLHTIQSFFQELRHPTIVPGAITATNPRKVINIIRCLEIEGKYFCELKKFVISIFPYVTVLDIFTLYTAAEVFEDKERSNERDRKRYSEELQERWKQRVFHSTNSKDFLLNKFHSVTVIRKNKKQKSSKNSTTEDGKDNNEEDKEVSNFTFTFLDILFDMMFPIIGSSNNQSSSSSTIHAIPPIITATGLYEILDGLYRLKSLAYYENCYHIYGFERLFPIYVVYLLGGLIEKINTSIFSRRLQDVSADVAGSAESEVCWYEVIPHYEEIMKETFNAEIAQWCKKMIVRCSRLYSSSSSSFSRHHLQQQLQDLGDGMMHLLIED